MNGGWCVHLLPLTVKGRCPGGPWIWVSSLTLLPMSLEGSWARAPPSRGLRPPRFRGVKARGQCPCLQLCPHLQGNAVRSLSLPTGRPAGTTLPPRVEKPQSCCRAPSSPTGERPAAGLTERTLRKPDSPAERTPPPPRRLYFSFISTGWLHSRAESHPQGAVHRTLSPPVGKGVLREGASATQARRPVNSGPSVHRPWSPPRSLPAADTAGCAVPGAPGETGVCPVFFFKLGHLRHPGVPESEGALKPQTHTSVQGP